MSEIGFPDAVDPAFQTRRSPEGDFVRAGSEAGLEASAAVVRYEVPEIEGLTDSLFLSQPVGYDKVRVWWGVPPEAIAAHWLDMCIVRSGFGHPTTPNDGQVLARFSRDDYAENSELPGNILDQRLPSGRWYYYTLFFRVGTKWFASGTTNSLVPIDYNNREQLLDSIPPFYRELEDEAHANFLTRWTEVIGYELDYTRTLTEGIEKIYDPDSSPQVLLDAFGEQNLGFTKLSGIGDIRYRSIISQNRNILYGRGTVKGLEDYLMAATKSVTTVTNGVNEMLLVDDAEFVSGVGNWCPAPWNICRVLGESNYGANGDIDNSHFKSFGVTIEEITPTPAFPVPAALDGVRGIAKVQAPAGSQLCITCGEGQQNVIDSVESDGIGMVWDRRHLDAAYRGIPVDPEGIYYFSFWMCRDEGNAETDLVVYGFAEYDREPSTLGFSDGFKGVSEPTGTTPAGFQSWMRRPVSIPSDTRTVRTASTDDEWEHFVSSFQLSEGTRYVVPFIWVKSSPTWLTARNSPITTPRYITGAMVNKAQGEGNLTVFRPDDYLRLISQTDPSIHLIGDDGNDDKVMGEP